MGRFMDMAIYIAASSVTDVAARRGFFGAAGNINPKKMEEEGTSEGN